MLSCWQARLGFIDSRGNDLSLIHDFLNRAKGQVVYVDIITQDSLFSGKVESCDGIHLLISNEWGMDCIAIDQIADVSLPKQAEIVAP
jgi:hypothetical protein